MQLRFRDKEHFFHDTAQMLRSGIPLERAMEHLARGRDRSAAAARIAGPLVNAGIPTALSAAGFSVVDIEIIAAGEQSGRLEDACRELADYHAHLARGRTRIISASIYPVFILHLAALLLSIPPAIISGNIAGYLTQVSLFLGIAYGVAGIFFFVLLAFSKAFQKGCAAGRLIGRIPVLGGFLVTAALARFCLVLSLGIRSADGVLASLRRAGRASGSACLASAAEKAIPAIRSGYGFAEALSATRAFPTDLERAFHVSEASGRLEEEISRWAGIYRDRYFQRIESVSEWAPRLLYMGIVAMVVWRIFSLIAQVAAGYSSLLEF